VRLAGLLLVAALGLPGCALVYTEVGVPVPEADGLEVGRTTKPEALALLGPPRLVQRQFDGDLYTWRRVKGTSRSLKLFPVYLDLFFYANTRSLRDDFSLLFDRDGVLRGMGVRLETRE
jgi:hypothetical protein